MDFIFLPESTRTEVSPRSTDYGMLYEWFNCSGYFPLRIEVPSEEDIYQRNLLLLGLFLGLLAETSITLIRELIPDEKE